MIRKGAGHKGEYGRLVKKRGARWKGGVPCRCSRCGKRKTLGKRPLDYFKGHEWRGKCCGIFMKVDHYRRTGEEHKNNRCWCQGYPWGPHHRRGSTFCIHGRAIKAGFDWGSQNDDDFIEWWHAGQPLP